MTTTEAILNVLEENEGSYVSGELLAKKLKISRMAISKAVSNLRKRGIMVESKKHYGYKLTEKSDVLDKEALNLAFKDSGIDVYYLDQTVSTNKDAKTLASEGAKMPYVVTSSMQTGGRGRLGRTFESPSGGVYFSLVLDGREIASSDLLTISVALAISEVMEELTETETSIKWVNDIYIRGKKAVGILTEGIINMEQKTLEKVVIGCGINLKTRSEDFSPSLRTIATSFYPSGNSPIRRATVIAECCKRIVQIQKKDFLPLYKKKCFVLNHEISVIKNGVSTPAFAYDVDGFGHLLVRYPDGKLDALSSGEITIRM